MAARKKTQESPAPDAPAAPLDHRLLFEQSSEMLLVLLPDAPRYTIVAATEAYLQATHTQREHIVGQGLFDVFPDNPNDPTATGTRNLHASLDRVLATRAADTMAVQKYDIRGPDGSFLQKYWSPKNRPVFAPDGRLLYLLHRVEDVTELVRASELGDELRGRTRDMEREVISRSRELDAANRELRAANAKLGELDAAKTAFFSNVSHEFRTPLTLMLGPLEDSLADTREPLGPQQRERLTLALHNALRLLQLVNTLLDFSRMQAGRLHARFAPLDLATFTIELAEMFRSATDKAGLRLVVECPPLTTPVWIDRDLWEKIVPNLVSNAFKFTLAGEIAVRLREAADHVVLEVSDTGVGIPAAELDHIFDRFHRVEGQRGRTHEGTGIGLTLVRELVDLHGGRVSVTSEVGRGSTFRVQIPKGYAHLPADAVANEPAHANAPGLTAALAADAARQSADTPPPAAEGAAAHAPDSPRARVLVVDDNADLRAYLAGLLAPYYEVTTANDGLEALEAVQTRRPDLVVSDVMMPALDGFGLLRQLRAAPETAALPVILLSARAGEESAIAGLDTGADDYLAKPFSARELIARVRTHVTLAHLRRLWIGELERANRELDAFSYSVSHDLRAPLRAIDGFSHLLRDACGGQLDETGRKYLAHIQGAVTRMNALIEGLLALSRVTRGELRRQPVDLTALAREAGARLLEASVAAGRNVTFTVAPGLEAEGDPGLLRAVIENLLDNAWKFTGKQPDARIAVGGILHDGVPTFFVRDNGAGFDMAHASKLFGTFQRLHTEREFEGNGIGLATVQRIVHRHGGRIWAEAQPGAGATFHFTLRKPPRPH